MARPKKQTVDYFPHMVNHGKTLFILEQKYNNDGYAFWFKLLEMLGSTEGHYIDLNDQPTWEFLQAKTHLSDSFCTEILNLLAKLEAIDPELWSVNVVWSQNFVDGISDVYKNRRVEMPTRPSFYIQKPLQDVVSTDEKPQSKVKETKVNKTKVNHSAETTAPPADDSTEINIPLIVTKVQESIKHNINSFDVDLIKSWAKDHSLDIIYEAVKETSINGATSLNYTDKILSTWEQNKVKSLNDLELYKSKRKPKGQVWEASTPEWLEQHAEYRKNAKDDEEEVDPVALKAMLDRMKGES